MNHGPQLIRLCNLSRFLVGNSVNVFSSHCFILMVLYPYRMGNTFPHTPLLRPDLRQALGNTFPHTPLYALRHINSAQTRTSPRATRRSCERRHRRRSHSSRHNRPPRSTSGRTPKAKPQDESFCTNNAIRSFPHQQRGPIRLCLGSYR